MGVLALVDNFSSKCGKWEAEIEGAEAIKGRVSRSVGDAPALLRKPNKNISPSPYPIHNDLETAITDNSYNLALAFCRQGTQITSGRLGTMGFGLPASVGRLTLSRLSPAI